MECRSKPKHKAPRVLMALLFYGVSLPLAVFLSLMPDSWFSADGYEDLGEREFVASQVSSRVSRHQRMRRKVIFRATDGSGLEFKIEYPHRIDAQRAVESRETIRRHMYAVLEKPPFRFFFHQFETQFLPPGADLQSRLDAFRTEVTFTRRISLVYSAAYGAYAAAAFLRRRRNQQAEDRREVL